MERRFTTPQRCALWFLRRAEIEWGPFYVWDGRARSIETGGALGVRRDMMLRLLDLGGVEHIPGRPDDVHRVAEWARAHADLAFTSYAVFDAKDDPAALREDAGTGE